MDEFKSYDEVTFTMPNTGTTHSAIVCDDAGANDDSCVEIFLGTREEYDQIDPEEWTGVDDDSRFWLAYRSEIAPR